MSERGRERIFNRLESRIGQEPCSDFGVFLYSAIIASSSKRAPARCGPRGDIPANFPETLRSTLPALIFSGNVDPVTPPQPGDETAHYLPNNRHVIIPQAAQGLDGLTGADCVDKIILEFIEKADAQNLDVSCVDRMAPIPFGTE